MAIDGTKILMGGISIILGLVLLPVLGAFVYDSKTIVDATNSSNNTADTNVTGVSGLPALIDLVLYGFTFGLVGLGIGLIYIGFKGAKK